MPKFTIRDLILLTMFVGASIAWWREHRELAFVRRKLAKSEAERLQYEAALNQTVLACYELGIHWQPSSGKIILRPTTTGDPPPIYGADDKPAFRPNFDITQFAGQRMPGAALPPQSRPPP